MPTPVTVTLDAGPAVHQRAGLSRYTERLIAALHQHCADAVALRLFYNRHSGHELPPTLRTVPSQTLALGQYAWRLSILASQLARTTYFPLQRRLTGSSLYHATEHLLPRLTIPTVMTVHDLIFERYPQHHKLTNRAFLRVGMPLFVRSATRIIAVSHHTAHDLNTLYHVPAAKMEIIHEGVDAEFQPAAPDDIAAIRARYSPDRPYLLMVGTLEPRKNHRLALTALAQLKAQGYPHRLLIAGGKGWLFGPITDAVTAMGLTNDVIFTGYVPGEDLPALYSGADCVLLPSQYEGFGLPLLEAMACGAPVVASSASSLPELAGDAALLIHPDDGAALAAAIRQILDQPEFASTLRARGLAQARRFTWEAAARQTAQLYLEMA
ncbi:MAG: glycosyltransferase family 4 protein [Caldilineaceae bacterium]|nr:glycosyltransferase family 4 protein [Caldilineaceae bacterium]